MADKTDETEEAREPHEHDAAAWAKHREAQCFDFPSTIREIIVEQAGSGDKDISPIDHWSLVRETLPHFVRAVAHGFLQRSTS
jgi:hypothetical protein